MTKRVCFQNRAIAYLMRLLALCLAAIICLVWHPEPALANEEVTTFFTQDVPAGGGRSLTDVPFTTPCGEGDFTNCDSTPPIAATSVIDINFGVGRNLVLQGIEVAGDIFTPATAFTSDPEGLANDIFFRRNPASSAPGVPAAGRSQLFFEYDPAGLPTTLNIAPNEAFVLEQALRSLTLNRGIDNLFNNVSTDAPPNIEETRNNIERVDYIFNPGLDIPVGSRDQLGFLVMDRGGNDAFQIAAILDVDATGNPTRYGPLIDQPISGGPGATGGNYGGGTTPGTFETVVTRQDDLTTPPLGPPPTFTPTPPDAPVFQPSHTVGAQTINGRFFRLSTLIPATEPSTTVFGYSIFADDVPGGADLVDFLSFPTDTTDANAAGGGLDLIPGGALFAIQPEPEIGLAKTNSAPRPVAGQAGFFDFDLEFAVTNTGNTVLSDVQITEDLEDSYITNATNQADAFSIVGTPTVDASGVTGTAPTVNPAYDGTTANATLFNAGNVFNVGDTAIVTVTVRVDLGTNLGGPPELNDGILVATNQATATGNPPAGPPVTDLSQNGRDVDPDNDGNPGNNNEPTPIQIPFPSIGVSKTVSPFRPVAGTTQYDFDFTITVTNTGATNLDGVTLQEPLEEALITNATNRADDFTVLGTPTITPTAGFSGTLPTANPAYDGRGNNVIFNGGSFNPGDSVTTVLTVRADLGSGGPGPLNDGVLIADNTATASGQPSGPGVPAGTGPISDQSQAGPNADPDGDGNPGNNDQPTPIQFPSAVDDLVLVKRITNIFRDGAALPVPGITNFNDQPVDSNDAALNAALGGGNQLAGIFQLPAGLALQPNDEVEYTIYFWNSSGGDITQLNICDELQPPSVLNTTVGFELDPVGPLGPPTFSDAGVLVEGRSPGAPLDGFCPSVPGTFPLGPPGPTGGLGVGAGGGVVAGSFNLPSNQFGAFRFRVRIP